MIGDRGQGKSALCQSYNNGHDKCDGTLFPEGSCSCSCHGTIYARDASELDDAMPYNASEARFF